MPPLNTSLPLPNPPENRFPDCLQLDITAIPLTTGQQGKKFWGELFNFRRQVTEPQQVKKIELYLKIKFDEQWEQLSEGRIKFGLRGGQLRFHLENGVMPSHLRQLNSPQIIAQGSATNPMWEFKTAIKQPVLQGVVDYVKLGTVEVEAFPCRIQAIFTISPQDIAITDNEALWLPNISRNKMAVLERLTILRILEPKLQPYLSQVTLQYD